jgi:hypothetical protein
MSSAEVRGNQVRDYIGMIPPPPVPNPYPLLKNLEVLCFGHGLNLGNGDWRGIFAWTERIAKGKG